MHLLGLCRIAMYTWKLNMFPSPQTSITINSLISQKTDAISYPAEGTVLNFFFYGNIVRCHSMDCCLIPGSKWWTHNSPPVTICERKSIPIPFIGPVYQQQCAASSGSCVLVSAVMHQPVEKNFEHHSSRIMALTLPSLIPSCTSNSPYMTHWSIQMISSAWCTLPDFKAKPVWSAWFIIQVGIPAF